MVDRGAGVGLLFGYRSSFGVDCVLDFLTGDGVEVEACLPAAVGTGP